MINAFTSDSAKSKIDKFSTIANRSTVNCSTEDFVSPKVYTLGVKGLNSTTVKYCSTAFH